MAAALRLQHQGKGGIGVDVDAVDGVHLDRNLELPRHDRFLSPLPARLCAPL